MAKNNSRLLWIKAFGSGRTRAAHAMGQFFRLIGCHLVHLLAAADQITFAAGKNGHNTAALFAFVNVGFF